MPLPSQTFQTITELISYINTYIIPNGMNEIDGTELNNVENALANFIVRYTLNSQLVTISATTSAVSLSTPFTLFTQVPASLQWPNNIQNEYYIMNATGTDIPLAAGFTYLDVFLSAKNYIPFRTVIHIAKAGNGQWIQVNNLGTGGSILPSQGGHQGQSLITDGDNPFWGDNVLHIAGDDPNWINQTTWINGSAEDNPSFSSPHFCLFWNDFSRFLLQNTSPAEWQYQTNGFQVLAPGFSAPTANVFLFFKGINS